MKGESVEVLVVHPYACTVPYIAMLLPYACRIAQFFSRYIERLTHCRVIAATREVVQGNAEVVSKLNGDSQ